MKTDRRFALAVAALLVLAAPAARAAGRLDQPIDLELKEAPVSDTLESFGKVLDARFTDVDSAISGTVTVHMKGVPVRQAMDAVCKGVGCTWTFEEGNLQFVSTLPPLDRAQAHLAAPVDLKLKDADLKLVLRAFGNISGLDVEVPDDLSGKVTIQLENVAARKALDALCETYHCRWEVAVFASGPTLRFTRAE